MGNGEREVPRSGISISDLDVCLAKASFTASWHSASIHMPRINYQGSIDSSEWYTVERLLRKYTAMFDYCWPGGSFAICAITCSPDKNLEE
ncbi:putative helicase chr10 [Orobanche minor]